MSDEEVEKFEITDYDLDNEFNINRPRRRQTKNQQIYGIWADDSGDEGPSTGRAGFGARSRGRKGKMDTGAPISFVAGGVQQAGKKDKKGKEAKAKGEDEAEEEDEDEVKTEHRRRFGSSSSDSDDGGRVGFGARSNTTDIDGDIAGLRRKRAPVSTAPIQKGVGNWEKHTKGIGAKLLMQMGYQPGRGLGKELQGISAPVEAHLRKGRGAIGAYGPEKVTKMADLRPELKQKEEEEEEDNEEGKLSQWRKEGSKSAKVKYVYKSVDEVLEDQSRGKVYKREFNELSKVKVIDMTGPQQRVLSGYHAISGPQRPTDEWEMRKEKKFSNFALPELLHNLNLLVDMCEQDIIANDKKLRNSKDRIVTLEHEEHTLSQKVELERKQISVLEKLLAIVNQLENKVLDLDQCAQAFKELQDNHYDEYRMYDLGDLAPDILKPLLQEEMKDWNPFMEPSKHVDLFAKWRRILEGESAAIHSTILFIRDPYHRLVWEIWMPIVRTHINSWNCKDCIPLITLLENWISLLPAWVLEHVLDQQVLPRMTLTVEEWNPLTDTVPIHTWTHPWLPLLGQRLNTSIFPIIRHKLSTALMGWHPSDQSAHVMLIPWSKAFDKGDMDAFLIKNILPKLQMAMSELVINPHQQHLDNWNWVMDWEDLMPVHTMASLLDKLFFPKWLQVLTLWLNHSPDYEQVSKWYSGWKSMFSEVLLQQPVIKDHFRKALDLMNRAVSNPGQPIQAPPPEPSYSEPSGVPQQQQRYEAMASAVKVATQIPQGFKDLLQKRCEERGILFVPLTNRWREGKQVYRLGNIQIYIDRSVIFMSGPGGTWHPISLSQALENAST